MPPRTRSIARSRRLDRQSRDRLAYEEQSWGLHGHVTDYEEDEDQEEDEDDCVQLFAGLTKAQILEGNRFNWTEYKTAIVGHALENGYSAGKLPTVDNVIDLCQAIDLPFFAGVRIVKICVGKLIDTICTTVSPKGLPELLRVNKTNGSVEVSRALLETAKKEDFSYSQLHSADMLELHAKRGYQFCRLTTNSPSMSKEQLKKAVLSKLVVRKYISNESVVARSAEMEDRKEELRQQADKRSNAQKKAAARSRTWEHDEQLSDSDGGSDGAFAARLSKINMKQSAKASPGRKGDWSAEDIHTIRSSKPSLSIFKRKDRSSDFLKTPVRAASSIKVKAKNEIAQAKSFRNEAAQSKVFKNESTQQPSPVSPSLEDPLAGLQALPKHQQMEVKKFMKCLLETGMSEDDIVRCLMKKVHHLSNSIDPANLAAEDKDHVVVKSACGSEIDCEEAGGIVEEDASDDSEFLDASDAGTISKAEEEGGEEGGEEDQVDTNHVEDSADEVDADCDNDDAASGTETNTEEIAAYMNGLSKTAIAKILFAAAKAETKKAQVARDNDATKAKKMASRTKGRGKGKSPVVDDFSNETSEDESDYSRPLVLAAMKASSKASSKKVKKEKGNKDNGTPKTKTLSSVVTGSTNASTPLKVKKEKVNDDYSTPKIKTLSFLATGSNDGSTSSKVKKEKVNDDYGTPKMKSLSSLATGTSSSSTSNLSLKKKTSVATKKATNNTSSPLPAKKYTAAAANKATTNKATADKATANKATANKATANKATGTTTTTLKKTQMQALGALLDMDL